MVSPLDSSFLKFHNVSVSVSNNSYHRPWSDTFPSSLLWHCGKIPWLIPVQIILLINILGGIEKRWICFHGISNRLRRMWKLIRGQEIHFLWGNSPGRFSQNNQPVNFKQVEVVVVAVASNSSSQGVISVVDCCAPGLGADGAQHRLPALPPRHQPLQHDSIVNITT